MIDYDTYAKIHHLQARDQLSATQIARQLGLDIRTVVYWLAQAHFRQRQAKVRASKLDAYKPVIQRLLERHPYSAVQIYAQLHETGLRRRDHDPAQLPAYRATSETRASVPHPGFCAGGLRPGGLGSVWFG